MINSVCLYIVYCWKNPVAHVCNSKLKKTFFLNVLHLLITNVVLEIIGYFILLYVSKKSEKSK